MYSQQKQLIPVANKPVLFYAIEDVIEAGIHEISKDYHQERITRDLER